MIYWLWKYLLKVKIGNTETDPISENLGLWQT